MCECSNCCPYFADHQTKCFTCAAAMGIFQFHHIVDKLTRNCCCHRNLSFGLWSYSGKFCFAYKQSLSKRMWLIFSIQLKYLTVDVFRMISTDWLWQQIQFKFKWHFISFLLTTSFLTSIWYPTHVFPQSNGDLTCPARWNLPAWRHLQVTPRGNLFRRMEN